MTRDLLQTAISTTLLWNLIAAVANSLPPRWQEFSLYDVARRSALLFLSLTHHEPVPPPQPTAPKGP